MAASLSNADTKAKAKKRLPAEPRFWKRYSKHHEFPLSIVSSVFIHLLVGGLVILVITGALLSLLGISHESVPVEAIVVDAGGAGNLNGIGTGPANGAVAQKRENVEENEKPSLEQSQGKEAPPLAAPQKPTPSLLPQKDEKDRVTDLDTSKANERLNSLGVKLRSQLEDVVAGKGEGGQKGEGGGKGSGKGPGEGAGRGPGKQTGPLTLHQKRQNRWTLVFDTRSGYDYLRQLRGLNTILAVPEPGGGHLVFRKLDSHPRGKHEDIEAIPGLHWFDSKPDSVRSLAMALGLETMPEYIVAFFPPSLEEHLRDLEQRAFSGDEDDIDETYFRVVNRGGQYDVVCDEIKRRR
jgi:hypothetical protein